MPCPPGPILLAFIEHFIGFHNSVARHLPRYDPWGESNVPPYQADAELDVLFHTLEFRELLDAVTAVAQAGRFDGWPRDIEAAFGDAGRIARGLIHEEWEWDLTDVDYGELKAKARAGRLGLIQAKENVDRSLKAVVPQEKMFAEAERRYLKRGHSSTEPDNKAFNLIIEEVRNENAPLVAEWRAAVAKHERIASAPLVGGAKARIEEYKLGQLHESAENLQRLRAEIERRAPDDEQGAPADGATGKAPEWIQTYMGEVLRFLGGPKADAGNSRRWRKLIGPDGPLRSQKAASLDGYRKIEVQWKDPAKHAEFWAHVQAKRSS